MSSAINKKEYVIYSYKTGEIVATLDKYEHDQKIQKAVNAYKCTNKHEENLYSLIWKLLRILYPY